MKLEKEHIIDYISIIRTTWENAYPIKSDNDSVILINTFYEIFKKYPKEVMDKAVINAIKSSEFAPKPATIIKEIEKMQKAFQKSDLELWQELTSCLWLVENNAFMLKYDFIEENGKSQGENARERIENIFNSLSSEIREFLGSSRTLVELSKSDNLDFEKARFLKMMPEIKERKNIKENIGLGLKEIK